MHPVPPPSLWLRTQSGSVQLHKPLLKRSSIPRSSRTRSRRRRRRRRKRRRMVELLLIRGYELW